MLSHGAVASRYFGKDVVFEAFSDWTKARVRPEAKAILGMLAKLTLNPKQFSADDMYALLRIGISVSAIEQAVMIGGFIFNYQNRMADALGADIPSDKIDRAGAMLNLEGRSILKDRLSDEKAKNCDGVIPPDVDVLIKSIYDGVGETEVSLRQSIFRRGLTYLGFSETDIEIPVSLNHYVDQISQHAADVTDQDIHDLIAAGWTESCIFEITVTASAAAGYGRLKIAWEALMSARTKFEKPV